MKRIEYDVEGITDIGNSKKVNQDNYVYKVGEIEGEVTGIFAVADGVGGLKNGEIASAIAISMLNVWWDSEYRKVCDNKEYIGKSLEQLFNNINHKLIEEGEKLNDKMGTTLSVMVINKNEVIICHIGDSRIYRLRKKLLGYSLEKLTTDHSKEIRYEVNNEIVVKSFLTQCLGVKPTIVSDISFNEINNKDKYIVCSDGIYKEQNDKTIKDIIVDSSHAIDMCSELINNAKRLGETDNITVIGIEIKETN